MHMNHSKRHTNPSPIERLGLDANFLVNMTMVDWLSFLARNRFRIDSRYYVKALFITLFTPMNSLFSAMEHIKLGTALKKVRVSDPLFILGHWRHGTTHLHNLLSLDDNFAYASLWDATNPRTILNSSLQAIKNKLKPIPPRRPMDNIPLSAASPQEEDLAMLVINNRGALADLVFTRTNRYKEQDIDFRGLSRPVIEKWKRNYLWFLKKLSYKYQKPLVVKSPCHTGRIKYLRELFPDARFVHILRDPYRTFTSTCHLYATLGNALTLQNVDADTVERSVISRYKRMYHAYLNDRASIPASHLCEIRYEDLVASPLTVLDHVYKTLKLPDFEKTRPAFEAYLDSVKDYGVNRFPELTAAQKSRIDAEWGPFVSRLNQSKTA